MKEIKNEKLSSILFIEIAEILSEEIRYIKKNFLVTLIKVKITSNMNLIKAYVNIYPFIDKEIICYIRSKSLFYRKLLSKRLRYRIKKIPKLDFYIIDNNY
ncbi:ribosome-binding factor A [Blattabacterium cuenoti]|uniref:ribosome-binding factor A n=1 Tax=Blattabacterium cuenoti TaxID=1653831 RepID=UPI00163D1F18|nr:ribosome-binding factor A [Blattabacterium cuenoti]